MDFLSLPDSTAWHGTARQIIDATTEFGEHRRVKALATTVASGMYRKRQGAYEYLVRTRPDNKQARIGPRSPQTEGIHAEFSARKLTIWPCAPRC